MTRKEEEEDKKNVYVRRDVVYNFVFTRLRKTEVQRPISNINKKKQTKKTSNYNTPGGDLDLTQESMVLFAEFILSLIRISKKKVTVVFGGFGAATDIIHLYKILSAELKEQFLDLFDGIGYEINKDLCDQGNVNMDEFKENFKGHHGDMGQACDYPEGSILYFTFLCGPSTNRVS
jgi:hypothetical protein